MLAVTLTVVELAFAFTQLLDLQSSPTVLLSILSHEVDSNSSPLVSVLVDFLSYPLPFRSLSTVED